MKKTVTHNLKNLRTFPCQQNEKSPATRHGYKDAILNMPIEKATSLNFNVGLALSLSNLIAIDMDVNLELGKNGIEIIKQLELTLGKLPHTLTQKTPHDGIHLIFSANGINPQTVMGKIGNAVDIKYNGYILVEPSTIDGKKYEFIDGFDENGNFIFAELPEKWKNYLNSGSKTHNNPQSIGYDNNRKIIKGDFTNMYQNCAFIRHCIKDGENLDEISWFYFACLLNSLSDGATLFDVYSRPHLDYDPIVVKQKFDNAKKYNVNCNTIKKCFSGCSTCPYNTNGGSNE